MKKLAKSTKWLIGALLALVMLLASFGIVSAVNGDKNAVHDDLTASADGGMAVCYIFIGGKEQKLVADGGDITSITTDWDTGVDANKVWSWRSGSINKTCYTTDDKVYNLQDSNNALGLHPTGSYGATYSDVTSRKTITYTITLKSTKKYTATFNYIQGGGAVLDFDPPTLISSYVSGWFSSPSHSPEPYTGISHLPTGASSGLNLTITRNGISTNDVIEAGNYNIVATPKPGYAFPDGSTSKTVTITISPREVDVTLTKNDVTYNGKPQQGYTIGGSDKNNTYLYEIQDGTGTDVGDYVTTLKLKDSINTKWASGAVSRVQWKITPAEQSFAFDTKGSNFEDVGEEKRLVLNEYTSTVDVPLQMTEGTVILNMTNPSIEINGNGVVTAEIVQSGGNYFLRVTAGQTLGTATITVTLNANKNFSNEAEATLQVKNTLRDGFYITGDVDYTSQEPNKIYKTLEEAIKAANAEKGNNGTADAPLSITARGNVTIQAPVEGTRWDHLELIGENNCTVTAKNDTANTQALFSVGDGKSLSISGDITINGGGSKSLLSLAEVYGTGEIGLGGESSDMDMLIKGFTNSAVRVSGGTLNAQSGVSFEGNEAQNGGAIYATGGKVALGGANFKDNNAAKGGAIYISTNATVSATATHSEFIENKAKDGGAIYIEGGKFEVPTSADVVMKDNATAGETETSGDGGAIYVASGTLDAEGGTLNINSGVAKGKGGAIYVAKGASVSLGKGTSVENNQATHGNGVYIADGAAITASTEANVGDGYMLGHDESMSGTIAQIKLSGSAPETGKTIVVEFEDPEKQLDTTAQKNKYVTGTDGTLDSAALKRFMRVKNPGYTFDPAANDGSLGLMESGSRVAAVQVGSGYEYFTSVQAAVDKVKALGGTGTIYLSTYTNSADSSYNTTEVVLDETVKIPASANITFESGEIKADDQGKFTFTPNSDTAVVLKRASTLTDEMITVEKGGTLTLGNVTLDGGAKWDNSISINDENGAAGTVKTNNTGVAAHAPVIVNNGTLNLGSGSTIQNNDNNWAAPGVGFGSENYGGGVRNQGAGVLNMNDGSTIKDCYSREGGAIMNVNKAQKNDGTPNLNYVAPKNGVGPQVNLKGGAITGCVSQNKGAAVQSIYGGATVTLGGGKGTDDKETGTTIAGNWSLNDLGVLSVEEGASLTVSAGKVETAEIKPLADSGTVTGNAQNKNAIYLYNKYSEADYEAAPDNAKPYIAGSGAGKLAVKGSPTIDGSVHLDDPCYVVDPQTGKASTTLYPTFVDVTGFEGNADSTSDGKLTVSVSEDASGKCARPAGKVAVTATKDATKAKAELEKVTVSPSYDTLSGNVTSGSFETNYKVGDTTVKGVGSFALEYKQTEAGKVTVSGTVDADCKKITLTFVTGEDAETYEITPNKDGKFSKDITMPSATATPSIDFFYGDDKTGQFGGEGATAPKVELKAVVIDKDGNLLLPEGWQYQADGETEYETWDSSTQKGLPQDIVIDSNGNALFKTGSGAEDATISVKIGVRAATPDPKQAPLYDLTNTSLTIVGESGLEYAVKNAEGNLVVAGENDQIWHKPGTDGKVTFDGLTAGAQYTVVVRRPATKGTLASVWVECPDSTYSTLTEAQQTAKTTFEGYFTDGKLNETGTADLSAVLEKYNAFVTGLGGADTGATVLSATAIAEKKAALDAAFAKDWLTKYEKDLQQAVEWVEGKDVFGQKGNELKDEGVGDANKVEELKKQISGADSAFTDLSEEAKEIVRQQLEADGQGRILDPVTNYCQIVAKQMQAAVNEKVGEAQEEDKDNLRRITENILDAAKNLDAIEKADTLKNNLDKVLEQANALLNAYNEATTGVTETRQQALLKEVLDEYSAQLAAEATKEDGNLNSIVTAATSAFAWTANRIKAENAYLAAYKALTGDTATDIFDKNGNVNTAGNEQVRAWRELAAAAFKSFGDVSGVSDLNGKVKDAIDALLYSFVETEVEDEAGSERVTIKETKEIQDIIEKAQDAVKAEVEKATSDVVGFAPATTEGGALATLGSVQKDLALQRLRDRAKQEYLDSYNAVKGAQFTWEQVTAATADSTTDAGKVKAVFDALQDKTDAAGLNTELNKQVKALLDSLYTKEGDAITDSKAVQDIIGGVEGADGAVEAVKKATDAAKDNIADVSSIVEGVKQKVALQKLYEELLEKAGGEELDSDLQAELKGVLTEALSAIENVEKGTLTTAEQLGAAQKEGADKLQLAATKVAAKQQYLDSYNALKGLYGKNQVNAASPAVAEAFGKIDGAASTPENKGKVIEALENAVDALFDALPGASNGSDALKGIITAAKKDVSDEVEKFNKDNTDLAPEISDLVKGIYEKVELQKKYEELIARADESQAKTDLAGKLATAKGNVDKVGTAADYTKDYEETLKEGLADLEATAALAIAKKEYLDSYNAINGTSLTWSEVTSSSATVGDAKAVKDVFGKLDEEVAGTEGTLQQRLNKVLNDKIATLLDSLVQEGDSKAVQNIVAEAKSAVNSATSVTDTIPEVSDLVQDIREAVTAKREEERKDAKETYKELYKNLTGNDAAESDPTVKAALDEIEETQNITKTNKVLAEHLAKLYDTLPRRDVLGLLDSAAVPTVANRGKEKLTDLAETYSKRGEPVSKDELKKLMDQTKKNVEDRRAADLLAVQAAYIEAYATLTGETVASPSDAKVKDAVEYIAAGGSCREALERLVSEMEKLGEAIKLEGDTAILKGYIDTVMGSFISFLKTYAGLTGNAEDRQIPTMKEKFTVNDNKNYTLQYFKSIIDKQRGTEKDATVEAYKALYEEIMGKPMDEEDEAVQEALAAILIGETNGKTQQALEAEVLKLLEGLLQKDEEGNYLCSAKEQAVVEAVKKAVQEIIAGAIGRGEVASLDALRGAVKGVADNVKAEREASIKAAEDAFKEVYDSFKGTTADPETDAALKAAIETIGKQKSFSEAHDALYKEIEKLLEGLLQKDEEGTALDSKTVQDIVKEAETAEKEVVDGAIQGRAVLTDAQIEEMKDVVDGISDKVAEARANDIKAAQKAYKDAYKAFMGEEVADPAEGAAKQALDNIGSAKNCAEANEKLAEEVKKLAGSALQGGDDSKAVKDYIEDVQKAVEEFVEEANDPENGGRNRRIPSFFMAELEVNGETVTPEEAKQAAEALREEEKEAAKEAFKEFYKEVTGKEADESDPAVKEALDALGKTEGITDLNDTLAEKTQELFDDLFTTDEEGNVTDSDESKQLVEEAKEALKEKFAEESKAGKTPSPEDVKKAVDELRAELEKQRGEETKASSGKLDGLAKGEEGKELPEDLQKKIDELVEAAKEELAGKDYEAQKFIEEKVAKQREVLEELAGLREKAETDGLGEELMEQLEKNAEAALEDIGKAETAQEMEPAVEKVTKQREALEELAEMREKATADGFGDELLEKFEKNIQTALEDIGKAGTAQQVDSAVEKAVEQMQKAYSDAVQEKIDAAVDELKEKVKDDNYTVRRVVTGKGGYTEQLKNAASAKEVEELLKEGKAAIEGERFLTDEDNEAATKDFSKVSDADKGTLESVKKAYDSLADDVKKYLDGKSGYTDGFAGLIADRLEKAKFEADKKAKAEEAQQFLRDCDGYSVKEANAEAIEDLEDLQYEPHTDGATRNAHVAQAQKAIQDAYEDVGKATAHAQSMQRFENSAKEEAENRRYSGKYSDAGKQAIEDAVKEYVEKVKEIPAAGKDGKTAQELVDGLYEEFLGALADVPVRSVTSEELTSSTPEYGAEDEGELWGSVTGGELPGGSSFAGSFKEGAESHQEAVENGKPVAGAGLGEKDPEKSLSGKEVKSVFDVNLTKDGKEVEAEGEVEVRVLLPEELRREKGLQVVVVDDAGNVHVLGTRVDGNYLVFSTDTFGEFVVLGEKVINLWWLIILLIVAIAVEGCVIAFFLVKKNKAASIAPLALLAVIIPAPAIIVCIVLGAVLLVETAGLVLVLLKKQKHASEAQPQKQTTEAQEEKKDN